MDFVIDVVQFRGQDQNTRWEFQYAFADTTVSYTVRPDGFVGELYCKVALSKSGSTDTTYDEWIAEAYSTSSRPTHRQYFSGNRRLSLSPGSYNVSVAVRDLNDSTKKMNIEFVSEVLPFGLQPELSDLMLTLPRPETSGGTFSRNGVDAVPNPRHEMTGQDPVISLYAEVYNAKLNNLDTFAIEYKVVDNVKREVMTTYGKMIGTSDGLVVREDIPAGAIQSGVYGLQVSILSQDLSTVYSSRTERIYILNPALPPVGSKMSTEEERFLASEWSVKEGEALDHELELAMVLASQGEKITAEGLIETRPKQHFLYRFWLVRDPDATTMANERLDQFRKDYQYAQTFYSSAMMRDGWRTDRGNARLKWGPPTQVEQFIQTMDTRPYEIWFYQNIQGGVRLYFVDWQVMQNHKLVHTTMIGQIRDESWFDRYARAFTPDLHPTNSVTNPAGR